MSGANNLQIPQDPLSGFSALNNNYIAGYTIYFSEVEYIKVYQESSLF